MTWSKLKSDPTDQAVRRKCSKEYKSMFKTVFPQKEKKKAELNTAPLHKTKYPQ